MLSSLFFSSLIEISVDGIGGPIVPLNGSDIMLTDTIGAVSVKP